MARRYAITGPHNAGKTTRYHTVVSILVQRGASVELDLEPSRRIVKQCRVRLDAPFIHTPLSPLKRGDSGVCNPSEAD